MKQILVTLVTALTTVTASAGTICNINRSTQKDSTFDQILYSSEVKSPEILMLDTTETRVEPVDFSKIETSEDWAKLDGRSFVAIIKYEDDSYTASIGKVDLSMMDESGKRAPLTHIVAAGTPELGKPLSLILLDRHLSVACFKLP